MNMNPGNTIDNDDAETIIRSCGQLTRRLWPNSFPVYTPELYCYRKSGFMTNLEGEETLIADMSRVVSWRYHTEGKVLAVGLESGAVAICKFVTA